MPYHIFVGECSSVLVLFNGRVSFHGPYAALVKYAEEYGVRVRSGTSKTGTTPTSPSGIKKQLEREKEQRGELALLQSLTNSAQETSEVSDGRLWMWMCTGVLVLVLVFLIEVGGGELGC